jgi:hypothetical protein
MNMVHIYLIFVNFLIGVWFVRNLYVPLQVEKKGIGYGSHEPCRQDLFAPVWVFPFSTFQSGAKTFIIKQVQNENRLLQKAYCRPTWVERNGKDSLFFLGV